MENRPEIGMVYRRDIFPFLVGSAVALLIDYFVRWWGFLVIFPWVGLSISIGNALRRALPAEKRHLGRKVAMSLCLPIFVLFIPLANNENLQLEGVVLLLTAGYFSKGVIHYAIAKIFGPLVWGRGFCGWACWTAAILDWLPIGKRGTISPGLRRVRYLSLLVSVSIPVALVTIWRFDVRGAYLNRLEARWMFAGNALYYVLAIPLAYLLHDRRAFCKVLCPVSLVMKPQTKISLRSIEPTGTTCVGCGKCNKSCPMDVDVMAAVRNGEKLRDSECILCRECALVCPVAAI